MRPRTRLAQNTARLVEETHAVPSGAPDAGIVPASAPVRRSGAKPKIGYLTTSYPSVSHTFIRREILGLEALGYEISRIALRPGTAIIDTADRQETGRTHYLLTQPLPGVLRSMFSGMLTAGHRVFAGLAQALALSRRSERGLLRHLAYLAEALMLTAVCRRRGISHVHVHFGTNAAAVAYLAGKLGNITYSMTVHGPDEFDAAIGFSLGDKIAASAFTVAISSFGASQLRRWVPHDQWEKIRVVHCSVGEEWFDAARPVAGDSTTLVCVGRLSGQKGQLLLIEAFAAAAARGLQQNLVLVGDGELRPVIERSIEERGLQERVTITGWCDEEQVRRHLLDSRALVLSSFAEGLPVVIMEAMALGRPVLSTSIMGIPELVERDNGWLVPAGDVVALADALLELGRTPAAVLQVMGTAGQRRVRERHSTATEAAKLALLFSEHAAGEQP